MMRALLYLPTLLLRAALWVISTLLVLFLLLLGALTTDTGSTILVTQVEKLVPGSLTIDNWHGALLGQFGFDALDYRHDSLTLSITQFELALDLSALRQKTLHFETIQAARIELTLPDAEKAQQPKDADTPFTLPDHISTPIAVALDQIAIDEFILLTATDAKETLHLSHIEGHHLAIDDHAHIGELAANLFGVDVHLQADMALSQPYALDGQLQWQGTYEDTSLNGTLTATGSLAAINLSSSGEIDATTIKGKTIFALDTTITDFQQIDLKKLRLNNDNQQLDANGQLDTADGLRWQLNANARHFDPSLFAPAWPGDITLSLSSQGFWKDWQHWELSLTPMKINGTLQDKALAVNAASRRFTPQQGQLTLNGNWGKDILQLNAALDQQLTVTSQIHLPAQQLNANLKLEAKAQPSSQIWKGHLLQLDIDHHKAGNWQLSQPASFLLAATHQQLDNFCLQGNKAGGRLCVTGKHEGSQIDASLDASHLPLQLANEWLDNSLQLEGDISAQATLAGALDSLQQLTANWSLATHDASILMTSPEDKKTLTIQQAEVHGQLQRGQLESSAQLGLGELGRAEAKITTGLAEDSALSGELALAIPSLAALLPPLVEVQNPQGKINGQLSVSGTRQAPRISGNIRLDEGGATLPILGIEVTPVSINISGDNNRLRLEGSAGFGQQSLVIKGLWEPEVDPFALALTLDGDQLQVVNRHDAEVRVSPHITLQGDNGTLKLTGNLAIPDADIHPRELPEGTVGISRDQVFVDAEETNTSPLPLIIDLALHIGDNVHFKGFGLDAQLEGDLNIKQEPAQPAQLYGEMRITKGRYKAYGQNLAIENGRLTFQGPADDPGLYIRAIRKIPADNQTVGVLVTGTLQHPAATIFSDPQVEESEAMSYLLTGSSLDSGGDSDFAKIARALAVYGLQQGESLTNKIGDTLGIDDISIGSDWGDADDAALMLGKRLSNRLYLSYSIGLFDAISTVMFRYILSRSWHLEAKSNSQAQSIDLIWQKEFR